MLVCCSPPYPPGQPGGGMFSPSRWLNQTGNVWQCKKVCTSPFGPSPPLTLTAQQVNDSPLLWPGFGTPSLSTNGRDRLVPCFHTRAEHTNEELPFPFTRQEDTRMGQPIRATLATTFSKLAAHGGPNHDCHPGAPTLPPCWQVF